VIAPDTRIALFPLQILIVVKSEQFWLATQILFHPHPLVPEQVNDLRVFEHSAGATHPDPVVRHPDLYEAQASWVVNYVDASVHTLGAHGATESVKIPVQVPSKLIEPSQVVKMIKVPLQLPSEPIYPPQIVLVPK